MKNLARAFFVIGLGLLALPSSLAAKAKSDQPRLSAAVSFHRPSAKITLVEDFVARAQRNADRIRTPREEGSPVDPPQHPVTASSPAPPGRPSRLQLDKPYAMLIGDVAARLDEHSPVVFDAADYARARERVRNLAENAKSANPPATSAAGRTRRARVRVEKDFIAVQFPDRVDVVRLELAPNHESIAGHTERLKEAAASLPAELENQMQRPQSVYWNGKQYMFRYWVLPTDTTRTEPVPLERKHADRGAARPPG